MAEMEICASGLGNEPLGIWNLRKKEVLVASSVEDKNEVTKEMNWLDENGGYRQRRLGTEGNIGCLVGFDRGRGSEQMMTLSQDLWMPKET